MRRQQIIETVLCDRCGEETMEPTAFTIEIKTRGAPLCRTIDLCPTDAPLVTELYEMLHRVPADDRSRVTCPLCRRAMVEGSSMSKHLVREHGAAVAQPGKCPDCGAKGSSSTAMIAHRRHQHGYDHQAALLASVTSPKSKRAR